MCAYSYIIAVADCTRREAEKDNCAHTHCEYGNRVGCGIRCDQLLDGPGDSLDMTVCVYFV